MRSLLKEIESKFIELDETMDAVGQEDGDIDNDGDRDKSDDYLHNRRKVRKRAILQDDEELEEQNVTGAIAGYNTPAAFAKPSKWKNKEKTYESVAETMDSKYEKLIESYRSYATGDAKTTPEQKIKHTIKEVARKLQEIEQTINYASRLKTESGVARNGYGSTVDSALTKISERLIKISERVRALGE